jgi:hypothetical protein
MAAVGDERQANRARARIHLRQPFYLTYSLPPTTHAGSCRTTDARTSAARAGGGNAAPAMPA